MRLYRALLHLYPASFRGEYGEELCAVFADRRRRTSGAFAVAGLWLGAVSDTLVNAARIHWDILRQDLRFARRGLRARLDSRLRRFSSRRSASAPTPPSSRSRIKSSCDRFPMPTPTGW